MKTPYGLYKIDLSSSAPPRPFGTLEKIEIDNEKGRAEAVVVLSRTANTLKGGVLSDNLPIGAMREYKVPLK